MDLVVYTQPIDTTTPAGKLTFAVLSACAELTDGEHACAAMRQIKAAHPDLWGP